MQNEPQLSAEIEAALKDLENEAHTQGWEGVNDKNLKIANKVVREVIATAIESAKREEREKHIEIYRWLVGYYDFPERQEGVGAYWWRSHLMDKLKAIGIESLTTKEAQ